MLEWSLNLTSVLLGALLGIGALWIRRRLRGESITSDSDRDLRAELSLATEAAGIGSWRMDIATGKTIADKALQRILGTESDGLVGMHMVHPDELERSRQALRRAIENPDATVSLRTRIVRPDGQVRHIQTDFRRRRLRGKPQHGKEGE